mgnify:CR=1 FL=1
MNINDNFVDKNHCDTINKVFLSNYFPWYYLKKQTNQGSSFLCHLFCKDNKPNSDFISLIDPIVDKLKPKKILNIRANLCLKRPTKCNWHWDDYTDDLSHKTAIYYVNTNNGFTEFKNKKVKSKKNRIVIFDANQKHRVVYQTDTDARMVINFNYEYI